MANPLLDKFFADRFGGGNPFTGAGMNLGGAASGIASGVAGGLGGLQKPAPAGIPQGEPPWVTKAREARKRAKAAPGTPPPVTGGVDQAPSTTPTELPNAAPPPDPNATVFNQGPRTPGGLPGGYGGIMGGQGVPRVNLGGAQPPPLQRIPRNPSPNPPPPKAPRPDAGDVFGKVPGGGF